MVIVSHSDSASSLAASKGISTAETRLWTGRGGGRGQEVVVPTTFMISLYRYSIAEARR
jgi:hypothetical protein